MTTETETSTETTAVTVAPIVNRPAGSELTCPRCGRPLAPGESVEDVDLLPMGVVRAFPSGTVQVLPYDGEALSMGTCADCHDRTRAAQRAVEAWPHLASRYGRDNAVHRIAAALDAAALVGGARLPDPEHLDLGAVLLMAERLIVPGVAARWAAQFVPHVTGAASLGACAAWPWAHVTEDVRRQARRAVADLIAYRAARHMPPKAIAPPHGRACPFCGVASVEVPAVRVVTLGGLAETEARTWEPVSAPRRAFGGSDSGTLSGYLCPPCTAALVKVGSVGPSTLEHAYVAHLRRIGRTRAARDLTTTLELGGDIQGLRSWAVSSVPPGSTPWEHVALSPDLAQLDPAVAR